MYFKNILYTAILLVTAGLAFRPAPPPGTPSFIVEGEFEVEQVYIDAVVLDTLAEVVFIASLMIPEGRREIALMPNWPMDSVTLFTSMNIDESIEGTVVRAGERVVIDVPERPLFLRTSYEVAVRRALSGPPSEWRFGEIFAVYPPFEDSSGKTVFVPRFQMRVILPPKMTPSGDASEFEIQDMERGFKSYLYSGEGFTSRRTFQTRF